MENMDHAMVGESCRRLAGRIKKDGVPGVIVSIQTGGDVVARLLAGMLGCNLVEIYIARPDRTGVYKQIARMSKVLATIVYELLLLFDDPRICKSLEIPQGIDVLLVDDAIHSGKTIRLARRWVNAFFPSRVRVATITDMRWRKDSDYCECTSHVSFPWSKNNQEEVSKAIRGSYFISIDKT